MKGREKTRKGTYTAIQESKRKKKGRAKSVVNGLVGWDGRVVSQQREWRIFEGEG